MKLRRGVFLLLLMGAGCSLDELDVRPEPPGDVPAFTYELYCDGQGRFAYDGAALKLVRRLAHLERVYADERRGDARAAELVRELEEWFARTGGVVADTTTRPACLPLPELTPECQPNWQFLTTLLGATREADRLREVVAHAYAVRARERGVKNRVIVAGINLLMAGGMATGLMTKAAAAEARAAAPAIEAKSVDGLAAGGEAAAAEGVRPLVYGPGAERALAKTAERLGGETLNDLMAQGLKSTESSVLQFSKQTLDAAAASGRPVIFDLTHMQDIPGVLSGTGRFANTITGAELRYIQANWARFEGNVTFYNGGVPVGVPW